LKGLYYKTFFYAGRHDLFPNETIPNVKILNIKILNIKIPKILARGGGKAFLPFPN
jgi:hypothetical protein